MRLAGKSWISFKVLACLHLLAFSLAVFFLARRSHLPDAAKAILIACGFFIGISFEAYRFDDYHVISDVFFLLSMLLLLKLRESVNPRRQLTIATALGVFAGLTFTNRITDGAGLLFCVSLAIPWLARSRRAALLLTFCLSVIVTVPGIIWLTGDSFAAYFSSTVLHAAGPKGGASNVLARPFLLLWNSLIYLGALRPAVIILLCGLVAASWAFLVKPFWRRSGRESVARLVLGCAIICASLYGLKGYIQRGSVIVDLSALFVVAIYCLVFWVVLRIVRNLIRREPKSESARPEILLLLPFALLLAGSLSSGGVHFGLYGPIAFVLLISPAIFPEVFTREWFRSSFFAIVAIMAVSGAWAKVLDPVSWQDYRTFPMFSHRLLVQHPVYGPMVIDVDLHHFAERTCAIINTQPNPDLLSIPLPYINYYCAIPPWQGFVQTFFDTAGKDVIDSLMIKLDESPPLWILYERQLDMLRRHEILYNNGKRLPQRDLDDFIVRKVRSGQWKVVDRSPYLGDSWVLIRTR